MKIVSTNPSTNYEVVGEVEASTEKEIREAVAKARSVAPKWQELGVKGRVSKLRKVVQVLEESKQELAELSASEMGMPINETIEDVESGLAFFEWYLDHGEGLLKEEITYEDSQEVHAVRREPMGVAAAIVPWNFPLSNFVWQCGQNLVAGNTVVFKHSEEVAVFGKKLEVLVKKAKMPEGVFNVVHGDGKVGDFLVHQDVDLICFTGSSKVGKHLYAVGAEKFVPIVLELGGSAPGVVFEDADIEKVVDTVMFNRYGNCGQICDGLKRLIVHESSFDEVVGELVKAVEALKVGDAMDTDTQMGPLVADRQVKVLEEQVADAVDNGAKILTGGKRPKNLKGAYYLPTIVTNVNRKMRVWNEEVFGPVLPVVSFKTEDEAIAMANDTKYGLGAYIFTEDKGLFARVVSQVKSGMVSLNKVSYVRECNPFGGYKESGMGREHGKFGFDDVTQIKIVSREK